jgi:hypothetical protein
MTAAIIDARGSQYVVVGAGASLAGTLAAQARASAQIAELARDAALAASAYYPDVAAGEAATTTGQFFSTDDGAGSLIYYRRTGGGSVEIGRALTPAALALELAQDTGAGLIGTSTGDSVQEVLTAYDGRLDAIETITPTGENASDSLADLLRPVASGPREALVYNDADSVRVFSTYVTMGGFRFRGQYTKGRAPVFAMPATKVAEYNTTGCPVLSAVKTETWVAVFACADSGDATATIRTMPFLRLAAPSGSTANIIKGGERVHDLVTTASHSWASTNNLAGTECLVISEGAGFSGRVTTITANTSTSVTLATIGSIAAGDYILPAPPGWDHYVYLGSFYYDTAEVRNFYDTGNLVKGKMVYITSPDVSAGSEPSPGQIMDCRGYISPLATGVVIDSSGILSTASTGGYAEYFDPDGAAHVVDTRYLNKNSGSTESFVFSNIQVPFLYHQRFNYYNDGALVATLISGQLNITGWFEP